MNLGSKMVIDAQSRTSRRLGAGVTRDAPRLAPREAEAAVPREVPDPRAFDDRDRAHRLAWGAMLVVQTAGDGRAVVESLIRRPEYAGVRWSSR